MEKLQATGVVPVPFDQPVHLVAQSVCMFQSEANRFDGFQHVDVHDTRSAAECFCIVPENLPGIVDDNGNDGHLGFHGQPEWAVFEIVQMRGELFANVAFGKYRHASPFPEIHIGTLECPKSGYPALAIQRDVDGLEKHARDRITEQFHLSHERKISGAEQYQCRDVEVGCMVGTDDAGLGPVYGYLVSESIKNTHECRTQKSDDPPATGDAVEVALGIPCQDGQQRIKEYEEK